MKKRQNVHKSSDYFGALEQEYESPYDIGELQIKDTIYVKYVKRVLDFLISLIAVIVTLPINAVIFFITLFSLGRPIFFIQERPGLGEKPFKIVKFRNMTNERDENGKLLPPSERVTKLGSILRKTSLDELLQFWSIMMGKMSIIGPRPLLMNYLPKYSDNQHLRHSVRPGLECPLHDYDKEITWDDRLQNDIWYAENVSFKTDLIMFKRLLKLIFNKKRNDIRGGKIDMEFNPTYKD